MKSIPFSAIERVEVLRDGASNTVQMRLQG
jgi:outer membrane receptor protein involved in Fe transport